MAIQVTSTPAPVPSYDDRLRRDPANTGGVAPPVASKPMIDTSMPPDVRDNRMAMNGAAPPPSGGYNAWTNPAQRQNLQTFLAGDPSAKPNPIRGRAYSNAAPNQLIQAQGGTKADMWRAQQARRRGLGRGRGFNRGFQGQLRSAYDQFLKGQAGAQQPAGPQPSKDFRNQLGGYIRHPVTGPYNPGPIGGTGGVRDPIYKSPGGVMPTPGPISRSPGGVMPAPLPEYPVTHPGESPYPDPGPVMIPYS